MNIKGKFEKQAKLCLIYIYNLSNKVNQKDVQVGCVATTKYLAKQMNKSTRQVERYLRYLKDKELININTSDLMQGYKMDDGIRFTNYYKKRTITTTCTKPEEYKEVLKTYFNKKLSLGFRQNLIKGMVKNFEPLNNVKKIDKDGYSIHIDHDYKKMYQPVIITNISKPVTEVKEEPVNIKDLTKKLTKTWLTKPLPDETAVPLRASEKKPENPPPKAKTDKELEDEIERQVNYQLTLEDTVEDSTLNAFNRFKKSIVKNLESWKPKE
jgi:hypothetical protein